MLWAKAGSSERGPSWSKAGGAELDVQQGGASEVRGAQLPSTPEGRPRGCWLGPQSLLPRKRQEHGLKKGPSVSTPENPLTATACLSGPVLLHPENLSLIISE